MSARSLVHAIFLAILASALSSEVKAACYPTTWFSEEEGTRQCADGYVLKGVACRGSYCDDKKLLCCSTDTPRDALAAFWGSPIFSEEPPHGYVDIRGFVTGLTCRGSYCDNISMTFAAGQRIGNTGACYPTPPFSEEGQGYQECAIGYFVSGITCSGSYCDNLTLTCCRATGGRDGREEGIVGDGDRGGKGDRGGTTTEWPGFHGAM